MSRTRACGWALMAAAVLGTCGLVRGADGPWMELAVRYAGSSSAGLSAGQITAGSGLAVNPNLTMLDLNDAGAYATGWVHYFDIGFVFHPGTFSDGYANESFRAMIVDLTVGGRMELVDAGGLPGGTGKKYFPFMLMEDASGVGLSVTGDAGRGWDGKGLVVIEADAAASAQMQLGVGGLGTVNGGYAVGVPTYVGRVATRLSGGAVGSGTLGVEEQVGMNFSYFINNAPAVGGSADRPVTMAGGIVAGSLTVGTGKAAGVESAWQGGTGSWSAGGNWIAGVPEGRLDRATFGEGVVGAVTVTVDGFPSVERLTFASEACAYTLAPGGAGSGLYVEKSIVVSAGNPVIGGNVRLGDGSNDAEVVVSRAGDRLTLTGKVVGGSAVMFRGAGTTAVTGGTVSASDVWIDPGAAVRLAGGTLTGKCDVHGILAGTGAVEGWGVVLFSDGALRMELRGEEAFDHLMMSRLVVMGGALDVAAMEGFAPRLGDRFDLFDAPVVPNTFGSVELPVLGNGLGWDVSELYTQGVISVVEQTVPVVVGGDEGTGGVVTGGGDSGLGSVLTGAGDGGLGGIAAAGVGDGVVPEAGTLGMLVVGCAGLAGRRWRR